MLTIIQVSIKKQVMNGLYSRESTVNSKEIFHNLKTQKLSSAMTYVSLYEHQHHVFIINKSIS